MFGEEFWSHSASSASCLTAAGGSRPIGVSTRPTNPEHPEVIFRLMEVLPSSWGSAVLSVSSAVFSEEQIVD